MVVWGAGEQTPGEMPKYPWPTHGMPDAAAEEDDPARRRELAAQRAEERERKRERARLPEATWAGALSVLQWIIGACERRSERP